MRRLHFSQRPFQRRLSGILKRDPGKTANRVIMAPSSFCWANLSCEIPLAETQKGSLCCMGEPVWVRAFGWEALTVVTVEGR